MRNLLTIFVALLVFVSGVVGAALLAPGINDRRKVANLSVSDEVYDLPPEMAVWGAALGTFRGLAVNLLWQRAESLKNDGKYYQAVDLGNLITRLQPRFPKVWEFVSWNQAYNISVGTSTPAERWTWVKSGIDVLQNRGKGIDANPNSLPLYAQLGWIYYHKVGEFQDSESWGYKRELARVWHDVLGEPPLEPEAHLAYLRVVRDAARRVEDLSPEARELVAWLDANDHPLDRTTLRNFTVATRVPDAPDDADAAALPATRPAEQDQMAVEPVPALDWPQFASPEAVAEVVAFLRRREVVGDELNMDPAAMVRLAEEFGPLDYRHPAAHTLYWGKVGIDRALADEGRDLNSWVMVERNVLNALQTLAQSGNVLFDPVSGYLTYLPDSQKWLAYDDHFQGMRDLPYVVADRLETSFGGGYRNQMDAAISNAFTFGDEGVAGDLYDLMRSRYEGTNFADRYDPPLDEFVREQLRETLDDPTVARGTIAAMLTQALTQLVAHDDQAKSQRLTESARKLFDDYRERNPNPGDPLYKEMPPFEQLVQSATVGFIAGETGFASQRAPIVARARVFNSLPEGPRAAILLQGGQGLFQAAQAEGYDPRGLFAVPRQEVMQAVADQLRGGSAGEGRPEERDPGELAPRREIQ